MLTCDLLYLRNLGYYVPPIVSSMRYSIIMLAFTMLQTEVVHITDSPDLSQKRRQGEIRLHYLSLEIASLLRSEAAH